MIMSTLSTGNSTSSIFPLMRVITITNFTYMRQILSIIIIYYPSVKVLKLTKPAQQALSVHSSWRHERKHFKTKRQEIRLERVGKETFPFFSNLPFFLFNLVPFHHDQRKMLGTVCEGENRTENSTKKINHTSGSKHNAGFECYKHRTNSQAMRTE